MKRKTQPKRRVVRCPQCSRENPAAEYACQHCGAYLYVPNPTAAERYDGAK